MNWWEQRIANAKARIEEHEPQMRQVAEEIEAQIAAIQKTLQTIRAGLKSPTSRKETKSSDFESAPPCP
jgi:Skp family chaperone for outer membrane proteins